MNKSLLIISLFLMLTSCNEKITNDIVISTKVELNTAIKNAKPGDVIILKDGTYSNLEILFVGEGTKKKPITLRAETPGKVFIEGISNLEISGNFLNVEGLFFRNGHSPTANVIAFRTSKESVANNSSVSNCVILDFNNLERDQENLWVQFYGKRLKTLVEIVDGEVTSYRYYISQDDVEVGVNFYYIKDYGKYFKVDISILNNSDNRYNFNPSDIYVNVNGDVKKKEKYYAISYDEYNKKVKRRQNSNAFWLGFAQGMGNTGTTYSQSNTTYSDSYGYGYATTNTTSYSPALQQMQARQNAQDMSRFQNEQQERKNFINEGYLKNHTLFPNTQLEGYFLIPFHKKVTDIDMIIKLGDMEFDYSNDKWH
jgi:hypothetical protein